MNIFQTMIDDAFYFAVGNRLIPQHLSNKNDLTKIAKLLNITYPPKITNKKTTAYFRSGRFGDMGKEEDSVYFPEPHYRRYSR